MNNETENSQSWTHKPCKSAYQISVKDDQKVSIHVDSLLAKVCRSVPSTRWGINPVCVTRSPASRQRVCPLTPPFQQDSSPSGPLLFASLNRIGRFLPTLPSPCACTQTCAGAQHPVSCEGGIDRVSMHIQWFHGPVQKEWHAEERVQRRGTMLQWVMVCYGHWGVEHSMDYLPLCICGIRVLRCAIENGCPCRSQGQRRMTYHRQESSRRCHCWWPLPKSQLRSIDVRHRVVGGHACCRKGRAVARRRPPIDVFGGGH